MSDLRPFIEKIRIQEEKRVGDIYAECVRRGCELRYLKAFDTRVWLYPINQTKAYLDLREKKNKYAFNLENHIKQWKIYLQVLLELRPKHEKAIEWKEALELITSAEGYNDEPESP